MSRRRRHAGNWLPLSSGAMLGACSFVFGYIIMYVLLVAGEDLSVGSAFALPAWLYYNAQFAPIKLGAGFGQTTLETNFNLVTGDGLGTFVSLEVPALVYHLIPVVILIFLGAVLGKLVDAYRPLTGAISGMTLFVGTSLVALPGAFLFSASARGVSASPAFFEGFLLVGVLYPAVLGSVGGAIGSRL